jgi:hypothetical protein
MGKRVRICLVLAQLSHLPALVWAKSTKVQIYKPPPAEAPPVPYSNGMVQTASGENKQNKKGRGFTGFFLFGP